MDPLDLSDSDSDAPFDAHAGDAATAKTRAKESQYTTDEAREAALRRELDSIRAVNTVIEGVVHSLQKAKDNMATVSRTVQNASTLLQTWTRILSQTEHNQRLILNPQWQGASQDLADIDDEQLYRQQAVQRRATEEQARRDAAARQAEEERRKAEAAPKTATRGRGRGTRPRGASSSASGNYVGVGGQAGRGAGRGDATRGRAGSGIGRGLPRGRGRGAT